MKPLVFILAVCSLASCSKIQDLQESQLNAAKKSTLYDVRYGTHIRHTLHIALPAGRDSTTPVIIFIHGGAWLFGDKNVHDVEMAQYVNHGVACATINYRLASNVTGVRYEDMLSDVRSAIDYIASKSEDWHVSPKQFALVGQSAGGHLALCAAYAKNEDSVIKAVVSWAGPANLLDDEQLKVSGGKMVVKNLLGRELHTAEDSLAYKNASPYFLIHPNIPPTLLIQGTKDIAVPYKSIQEFDNKLQENTSIHHLELWDGEGHLWYGKKQDEARDKTIAWCIEHTLQ